ncbi:MAG: SH3 domain-containing protein [Alphaproteobacteria bacterium]|nr:SH3 domain-containing protein [Alphaproteobacteria bacterium]
MAFTAVDSARPSMCWPPDPNLRARRLLSLAAAVMLLAVLAPLDASACGRIQLWMAKYEGAPSDAARSSALRDLSSTCAGYVAKQSDRALLPILADAVARGIAPQTVQTVFENFRCLPGARDDSRYAVVSNALDLSNCPTAEDLQTWKVSLGDGVIIRSKPDRSSKRAGWVDRGTVVAATGRDGEWIEITDWHGRQGFIHSSLLADYETFEPQQ